MNAHTPGQLRPVQSMTHTGVNWIKLQFVDGYTLAFMPKEKADQISTAVNSHADLVAALQAIVDLDDGDKPDLWHFEKEFANARVALAKAGV